jgi:hypothetical protein
VTDPTLDDEPNLDWESGRGQTHEQVPEQTPEQMVEQTGEQALEQALEAANPKADKMKISVGLWFLGFFAAVGYVVLAGALWTRGGPISSVAGIALIVLGLVGVVSLLIWARTKRNARVRSFAIGGLWAYGIGLLVPLLVFGSCLIVLSNFNK